MHNVGNVLQDAMPAQFAVSTRNLVMTEMNYGNSPVLEDFIAEKLEIKIGMLKVSKRSGIGMSLVEPAIKEYRMTGEP